MNRIIFTFIVLMMHMSNGQSMVDGAARIFSEDDRAVYARMMPDIVARGVSFLETMASAVESGGTFDKAAFNGLRDIATSGRRDIAIECAKRKSSSEQCEALDFGQTREGTVNSFITTLTRSENEELYGAFSGQMCEGFNKKVEGKKHLGFLIKSFEDFRIEVLPGGAKRALDQDTEALFGLVHFKPFEAYSPELVDANLAAGLLTYFRIDRKLKINGQDISAYFIYALSNRVCQSIDMKHQRLDFMKNNPNFCILHALPKDISVFMDVACVRWKNIMRLNPQDEDSMDSFCKNVADLYWFHSVAAPYVRGSEAILRMILGMTMAYKHMELLYNVDFVFRMPFAMSHVDFQAYFKDHTLIRPVDGMYSGAETEKMTEESKVSKVSSTQTDTAADAQCVIQ